MLWRAILFVVLGLIVYIVGGIICGRICADNVRRKNCGANEVDWFWAGFFFNMIAVFATLTVKRNDDGKKE